MNKVTPEIIAAMEQQHGRILHLEDEEAGDVLFRKPKRTEHQRFVDELADPEMKGRAVATLVMACRVWPDEAEFGHVIDEWPGLAQSFGGPLVEFAGVRKAVVRKK